MNAFARCNKNNKLTDIVVGLMGVLVLTGLVACSSSGGGGTPEAFITRISVNATGEGGDGLSQTPDMSADGRYVVFESSATNLVTGDTNDDFDIFLKDTQNNTIKRISVDSAGVEANGRSRRPVISADGEIVVYYSDAANLVTDDLNDENDVFLYNIATSVTTRISIADGVDGVEGNGRSDFTSINADGSYVAFRSLASNLVTGDMNNRGDIFLRDTLNNTTTRVSIANGVDGAEGNDNSHDPSISADGQVIAFESFATNLVDSDTNGFADIFVRNIANNTTTKLSLSTGPNEVEGNSNSLNPSLSADGQFVSFVSIASNLVADDLNNVPDLFLRDIANNITTRISVDSNGEEVNERGIYSSISQDGRYIAFQSIATNLVANDTNGFSDVFIRDTQTSETFRVSVDQDGAEADGDSREFSGLINAVISDDGRYVAFGSEATNLVSDDVEMQADIFRVLISKTPQP